MGWIRKTGPYLLLLLVVLGARPNAVEGNPSESVMTGTRVFTIRHGQNEPMSSDRIEFTKNITLGGGSVINVTGLLEHENATTPSMNFEKRYQMNATIIAQSWGADVDRIHNIRFILRLQDEGTNEVSSLERETFYEIPALNHSIQTTVFFIISQEKTPDPEKIVSAAIVLACKEGRLPYRIDAETEVELIQFPLELSEGPSQVETSPKFTLDEVQGVDGTLLRIWGNITIEEADPPFWYYGTLYTVEIMIEVLEWGWDARGTVQRIHDIAVTMEFIGEGGVSVHSINVPTDPDEIMVIHAPISHKFAYSVSEQDIMGLEEAFLSLQLQFKEELVDRNGKTHQDDNHQELTRFLLNLTARSIEREFAFSRTVKLSKDSLVNVEGVLNLENTTPPSLYFGKRYSLTATITVVRWGEGVDRLFDIIFFLDFVGGGGAVLVSLERNIIPNTILELNSPLHTTIFFRLQQEMIPTTENVELGVVISLKEGVTSGLDATNREELTRFAIQLEERLSKVATSPDFTVPEVEGMDGTILHVTGNITVEESSSPFWYYDQSYTVRIELEVLEWGWDARGSVTRIHSIQVTLEYIGEGGIGVHSTSTSTEPSEIVLAHAPVIHEFTDSVSEKDVNALNTVTLSLQLSFTEEILGQHEETTQELTRFPLKLKESPSKGIDLIPLLKYGGAGILIVALVVVGRRWLRKREEDYWLK